MTCCAVQKVVFISAWPIFAIGAVLHGYVQQSLIRSYGWGVFGRYTLREQCGTLLSPRERRILWVSIALVVTGLAFIFWMVLFPCCVGATGA